MGLSNAALTDHTASGLAELMRDLPFVQVQNRKGRTYHYFRRGTYRATLPNQNADPAAYEREYARHLAASAGAPRRRQKSAPPAEGTVAWWAALYRQTPEWEELSPRTRTIYDGFLTHLIAYKGHARLEELNEARVWKMRDEAPGPVSRVNGMLKVLSQIARIATRRGALPSNPCLGVPPRPTGNKGHAAWPEEHVETFQAHWPRGTIQRTAFDLALYTAQRRGDVVRLRWEDLDEDGLTITQGKTGKTLFVPFHAELAETLAATPRTGPFIVGTKAGDQRSDKAFGEWFRTARIAAGVPDGFPFHGLRKTAAVRLVEAGCDVDDAAAITGHSNPAMLRHYAASADQKLRARRAMARVQESGQVYNSADDRITPLKGA